MAARRALPARRAQASGLSTAGGIAANSAIAAGGASSVTPPGRPSARVTRRHGNAAQVEQIDEIGVGAEPGIRPDRVGRDLVQRDEGRDRRHAQRVDRGKQRLAVARSAASRYMPAKASAAESCQRAGSRSARVVGWSVSRLLDEPRPTAAYAFGHPGALIEHARDRIERREVDLDDRRARAAQRSTSAPEIGRLHRVAERLRLAASGTPIRDRRQRRTARPARPARIGVGRVVAGRRIEHLPGVRHRQREDRDRVEGSAGRHHAARRKRAERRLQPDDAVERRRHAARAGRIGAEREGDDAARHRDRRSGRRAARHDGRVDRVARHRIGRAHADEAGRELVEIGLAEADRAGRAQPRHDEGVALRRRRRSPGRRPWSACRRRRYCP